MAIGTSARHEKVDEGHDRPGQSLASTHPSVRNTGQLPAAKHGVRTFAPLDFNHHPT